MFQVKKELPSLVPVAPELVERITLCRKQFEELRARVLNLAESFAVSTPMPEEISSLKALESLLQDVTEAQKKAKGESGRQIAKSILSGTGSLNPANLRSLIWQLICEDKLGLAFRLARYLEAHPADIQPRLPSWLMRALVVGRHMRYDIKSVEIAKTLMTDSHSDTCFVDGEGEWNQAVSLLLAASALRPALLAPNMGALEILRSLRLGEGLTQLHEYCQIIADCGCQLQSLDALALKKVKEQVAWQQALDDLRQRVEDWYFCAAPGNTMNFADATYVWRNWLEPSGLVHSLLLPVKQNDLTRLAAAKQEVKRLSDNAEIEREVDYTNRKILERCRGEDIRLDVPDLCRHLREAVEFVRCWIELQEYQIGSSNDSFQQQAQQLKQAVSNRQQAVLKELNSFEQRNSSVLLLAGIYCCRTAVKDIRDSFRSRSCILKRSSGV